jgi:photosystem II stability/assembly factor-like uncharacterized protein
MYKIVNHYHKHDILKLNISNYHPPITPPIKQIKQIQIIPQIVPPKPIIEIEQTPTKQITKIIPSILLNSNTNLSSKIKLKSIASDKNCQNLYTISNIGIYISNDYGSNWFVSSAPINIFWTAISCDYSGQHIIATALESSSIFKILVYCSNNYGKTWICSPLNNKNGYCVSITFNSNTFLALTSTGIIYESTDYGYTWNNKMTIYNGCNSLISNYNGQYLFLSSCLLDGGGIYISDDYGVTWSKDSAIDNCNSITCSYNGQYLAAICNNSGGIYTSNNYGKTWNKRIFFNNNWINITSDKSGQYLAATSFSNNNGDIYLSNDFGITWNISNTSINNWKLITYNSNGSFLVATTFNCLQEDVNINTYKVLN